MIDEMPLNITHFKKKNKQTKNYFYPVLSESQKKIILCTEFVLLH